MNLLITIAVGAIGGFIGLKVGLPQGALLGSLLAVAILSSSGALDAPALPQPLLFAMYVLIGVELGSQVNRSTLGALAKAWLPAVLFVLALLLATVAFTLIINRFFGLDLATALFGTSPGAISGITAMGAAVGANVPIVVAIHALRVTVIVFAIPWIYRLLT